MMEGVRFRPEASDSAGASLTKPATKVEDLAYDHDPGTLADHSDAGSLGGSYVSGEGLPHEWGYDMPPIPEDTFRNSWVDSSVGQGLFDTDIVSSAVEESSRSDDLDASEFYDLDAKILGTEEWEKMFGVDEKSGHETEELMDYLELTGSELDTTNPTDSGFVSHGESVYSLPVEGVYDSPASSLPSPGPAAPVGASAPSSSLDLRSIASRSAPSRSAPSRSAPSRSAPEYATPFGAGPISGIPTHSGPTPASSMLGSSRAGVNSIPARHERPARSSGRSPKHLVADPGKKSREARWRSPPSTTRIGRDGWQSHLLSAHFSELVHNAAIRGGLVPDWLRLDVRCMTCDRVEDVWAHMCRKCHAGQCHSCFSSGSHTHEHHVCLQPPTEAPELSDKEVAKCSVVSCDEVLTMGKAFYKCDSCMFALCAKCRNSPVGQGAVQGHTAPSWEEVCMLRPPYTSMGSFVEDGGGAGLLVRSFPDSVVADILHGRKALPDGYVQLRSPKGFELAFKAKEAVVYQACRRLMLVYANTCGYRNLVTDAFSGISGSSGRKQWPNQKLLNRLYNRERGNYVSDMMLVDVRSIRADTERRRAHLNAYQDRLNALFSRDPSDPAILEEVELLRVHKRGADALTSDLFSRSSTYLHKFHFYGVWRIARLQYLSGRSTELVLRNRLPGQAVPREAGGTDDRVAAGKEIAHDGADGTMAHAGNEWWSSRAERVPVHRPVVGASSSRTGHVDTDTISSRDDDGSDVVVDSRLDYDRPKRLPSKEQTCLHIPPLPSRGDAEAKRRLKNRERSVVRTSPPAASVVGGGGGGGGGGAGRVGAVVASSVSPSGNVGAWAASDAVSRKRGRGDAIESRPKRFAAHRGDYTATVLKSLQQHQRLEFVILFLIVVVVLLSFTIFSVVQS